MMEIAVQKVELVGADDWWTQHGSAAILAIAAIVAAGVAAYVAIWSHQRQLEHDRDLRNHEDVRNTIDAAVVSANEGRNIMDLFMASIETIEERREEGKEPSAKLLASAREQQNEAVSRIQAMRASQVRLEMRLPEKDAVAATHWSSVLSYNELFIKALSGISEKRPQNVREKDGAREEAATEAFSDFQEACHEWFRAQAIFAR